MSDIDPILLVCGLCRWEGTRAEAVRLSNTTGLFGLSCPNCHESIKQVKRVREQKAFFDSGEIQAVAI